MDTCYRRKLGTLVLVSILWSGCSTPVGPTPPPPPPPPPQPSRAELSIGAIAQQTQVWCWAAAAQMILQYYREPNLNPAGDYQCGIVGAYYYITGGPFHPCVGNCYQCIAPASSTLEIQRILTGYGQVAQSYGLSARVLTSQSRFGQLSLQELALELDAGRPILAGVSFPGQPTLPGISGHAVVFTGYDATVSAPTVTVRDPYPYELYIPANQNPYLVAGATYLGPGSYRIPIAALSGRGITWGNTIYGIQ
jgi:hypothetical protein